MIIDSNLTDGYSSATVRQHSKNSPSDSFLSHTDRHSTQPNLTSNRPITKQQDAVQRKVRFQVHLSASKTLRTDSQRIHCNNISLPQSDNVLVVHPTSFCSLTFCFQVHWSVNTSISHPLSTLYINIHQSNCGRKLTIVLLLCFRGLCNSLGFC